MDGVFRRSELVDAGLARSQVDALCRDGHKLRRGVYVGGSDPADLYALRCAAVLEPMNGGAALAGPSAAFYWDLPLLQKPDLVTLRGVARGRWGHGVQVVGGEADYQVKDGQRLTTPAWTVIDCARSMPLRDGLILADAALHRGLCTLDELEGVVESCRGRHGIGRARWVVRNCDPESESPGETWTRMVVRDLGYDLHSQFPVRDGDFSAHLDFLIKGTRVGIEFDGLVKYFGRQKPVAVVLREKSRQSRIEELGYLLLRVVWHQLDDPDSLDRRIRHYGAHPVRPRAYRTR